MGCLQAKERAPQQIQSRPGQVVPLEVLSVVPLPLGQQPQGARQQPVPQHVEGGLGGADPAQLSGPSAGAAAAVGIARGAGMLVQSGAFDGVGDGAAAAAAAVGDAASDAVDAAGGMLEGAEGMLEAMEHFAHDAFEAVESVVEPIKEMVEDLME